MAVLGLPVLGGGFQHSPVKAVWRAIDGTSVNPFAAKNRPVVLLFLLTDCPIANSYAPEIHQIALDYKDKISFLVVYVDEGIALDVARQHAMEFDLQTTALLDPTRSLANRVGATASPEAVVLDAKGRVVYRGRIDDRHVAYGKSRPEPKRRDLRLTLDTLLHGKRVEVKRTTVVGCVFGRTDDRKGRGE